MPELTDDLIGAAAIVLVAEAEAYLTGVAMARTRIARERRRNGLPADRGPVTLDEIKRWQRSAARR